MHALHTKNREISPETINQGNKPEISPETIYWGKKNPEISPETIKYIGENILRSVLRQYVGASRMI